jgi:hypothetical protein
MVMNMFFTCTFTCILVTIGYMSIKKYLPKKISFGEIVPAQALVPKTLWDRVNKRRELLHLTWNELMIALFEAFLDDTKEK